MAAQQKIAQGVQEHGLGQGAGLVFGAGLAQSINPQTAAQLAPATPASDAASALTLEQQIEGVKKLKELLDSGILSPDEFEAKKK
jgi:hypothetical protein